ncbi:hypothetical protein [Chitinophaga polysaccharea]|nr:hypothetical protein [Chitinophaga polysaccharea]
MYEAILQLGPLFREKVVFKNQWSTSSYYRKFRENVLTKKEKVNLIEIWGELLKDYEQQFKYVLLPVTGRLPDKTFQLCGLNQMLHDLPPIYILSISERLKWTMDKAVRRNIRKKPIKDKEMKAVREIFSQLFVDMQILYKTIKENTINP